MWKEANRLVYEQSVADLIHHPLVQQMDGISQHAQGISCLDHSIFVSYVSFSLCRLFRLDAKAAARAGLLHDLYLCDWNKTETGIWERLLVHPAMALENARRFGLSPLEEDAIRNHMWPVTLFHIPHHRESVVVSLADKICTISELCYLYRLAKAEQALERYNHRRVAMAEGN